MSIATNATMPSLNETWNVPFWQHDMHLSEHGECLNAVSHYSASNNDLTINHSNSLVSWHHQRDVFVYRQNYSRRGETFVYLADDYQCKARSHNFAITWQSVYFHFLQTHVNQNHSIFGVSNVLHDFVHDATVNHFPVCSERRCSFEVASVGVDGDKLLIVSSFSSKANCSSVEGV